MFKREFKDRSISGPFDSRIVEFGDRPNLGMLDIRTVRFPKRLVLGLSKFRTDQVQDCSISWPVIFESLESLIG